MNEMSKISYIRLFRKFTPSIGSYDASYRCQVLLRIIACSCNYEVEIFIFSMNLRNVTCIGGYVTRCPSLKMLLTSSSSERLLGT